MICRNVANDHVRQTPGYHPNCRNFQNDRIHQDTDKSLLPSATKLGQGYVFTGVCDSVHRGGVHGCCGGVRGCGGVHGCRGGMSGCQGCVWLRGDMCGCQGVCMIAGGACMVAGGGAAWLWEGEACVVAGGCMVAGGACVVAEGACIGYDEIRSMSGRYASYWNAFLLLLSLW